MQDNEKKPALRFKGFTDPWEQREFEEIAVRSSVMSDKKGLPRVEYEDIISGAGRLNKDIKLKESEKVGIVFHKGDVLYGKLRPYLQNWLLATFNGLAVGDFWVLQPQNTDSSFLYRLVQSQQFDGVANQSTGTKMPRADWKLVSKTKFAMPHSVDEQAAIGAYFEHLDTLITLHQRKYEKLVNIKKSMLDKMFPKNGASVPEIRFKGFTDLWEQRKLGELVEIGDIDHRMPETVADGIPYLMTGDFVGTNELNFDGTKMISEEDYCQLSQKIKPEKGDILFARYASVGAARYVDFTRKFLISYSCAIIKKSKKINSKYLYHFITSGKVQQQIKLEINTGSQANIGIDSMKNHIVVSMPPLEEQTKIADALSNLDHLITLHQRKLEKLQNIKKSCLEKMFV